MDASVSGDVAVRGTPGARGPEVRAVSEVVVSVRDLSKRFKLYRGPWDRLLEWASLGYRRRHEEFWALRDVTFEVRRGECLGVIGVNGAGKTTLLKILSRALYPTGGSFEVRGRLVSLLELGTGFQLDLTGRQNILQSAQLLGFSEAFVRDRLDAIMDFAQIGDFIDRPVRQYSSGMFVRLAFALFANLDPDVYIVDESLAVGDVFFQQRCFRRFRELRERGCTILLVSHDMEAITHLCDRAILLSGGKLAAEGYPVTVVHDYFALSGQAFAATVPQPALALPRTGDRQGTLDVPAAVRQRLQQRLPARAHAAAGSRATEIVGFAVSGPDGAERWSVECGSVLRFWYLVQALEPCHDLNIGIHFYDRRGILVFAVGTANRRVAFPALGPGDRVVCALAVRLALQPGEYTLVPQSGGLTGGSPDPGLLHDRLEALPPVVVTRLPGERTPFYGLVNLETDIAWTEVESEPLARLDMSAK
jgi:ABC-type polysaccharide/polyol phosphate transport system ATPase subunit